MTNDNIDAYAMRVQALGVRAQAFGGRAQGREPSHNLSS